MKKKQKTIWKKALAAAGVMIIVTGMSAFVSGDGKNAPKAGEEAVTEPTAAHIPTAEELAAEMME